MVKVVKAIVKDTVTADAEKKMDCRRTGGVIAASTFVGGNTCGLFPLVPQLRQGSDASMRVGDWVKGTQLRIKGTVALNPTWSAVNAGAALTVRVAILKSKKSLSDLTNLPNGSLLTVNGETNTDWLASGYNGPALAQMPYSDYFTVVKSYDMGFLSTGLSNISVPGEPLAAIYPGSGPKNFDVKINNPGKFFWTDVRDNRETQGTSYYAHIVVYDPLGNSIPAGTATLFNMSSYLTFTDV